MADEHLNSLFVEGTAPERDAAFARGVGARISRARLGLRVLKLAIPAVVIMTLAAAVFVAVEAIGPTLSEIAEQWPQFMGVPVPLILAVLAAGVAVRARRFVRLRLG
jgi:hypothetical protein